MKQLILAVREDSNKVTSSILSEIAGGIGKFSIGLTAFKTIWNAAVDAKDAVAEAIGKTKEQTDAALRMQQVDPEKFERVLTDELPDQLTNESADDINAAIAKAQSAAYDPSNIAWMVGGLVLMFVLFSKGGRSRIAGGFKRFRAWRSARRFRRSYRRRGRRY